MQLIMLSSVKTTKYICTRTLLAYKVDIGADKEDRAHVTIWDLADEN